MEYLTHLGRIRGLSTRVASARADQLVDRLALVGGKQSPLRTAVGLVLPILIAVQLRRISSLPARSELLAQPVGRVSPLLEMS